MATSQIWQGIQAAAQRAPGTTAVEAPGVRISYAELVDRVRDHSYSLDRNDRVTVVRADREGRAIVEVLAAQLIGLPALLLPRGAGPDYERSVRDDVERMLDGRGVGVAADEALDRGGIWTTTSGSTGHPKIVAHDPDGIDRFVAWVNEEFDFTAADISLSLSPMNFDVSLLDVWAVLAAGGRVVFVPDSQLTDGAALARAIADSDATIVQAVPVVFDLLLPALQPSPSVRVAISTGDMLRPTSRRFMNEAFPLARTSSIYGSTETNDSFLLDLRDASAGSLGRPIAGVSYRLEEHPDGGYELIVSTPFQAFGYVNAPNDVWSAGPLGREFRTGDLVTLRDGHLDLEGRHDRQVKVRGVRVSLADIEEVLRRQPGVIDAIAMAAPDDRGELSISVLLRYEGTPPATLEVRRAAADALPAAAVPSRIHLVDHPFPLTGTGKTDRREAFSRLERQLA